MEARIAALEKTVKGLTDKSQAPKVSFHAKMRYPSNPSFSSGQKITFNEIPSNDGNGYNSSDGIFTAPVAGTYIFMATVQSYSNPANDNIAQLYVKGSLWAGIKCSQSATMHAAVSLAKGEQVWVQSSHDNCSCDSWLSFFSGALVA